MMIMYPVYQYYCDADGETSWAQYKVFRSEEAREAFLNENSAIEYDNYRGKTWYEPWPIFEIEDK